MLHSHLVLSFFFFNDTATTEIYTLSLHDALPILVREIMESDVAAMSERHEGNFAMFAAAGGFAPTMGIIGTVMGLDRKSTRLNSSHANISYAVFCLKKKKK